MALASGSKLGPYEIQSPLGAGGMGEVYRARDTRLDRTVAVKILPESFANDADRLQRFEHEARILIHRTGEVPARVERLDLSTGKRVLFRELAPPSRAGVLDVTRVAFSDDERWYAYDYSRVLCRLSSVTGVK